MNMHSSPFNTELSQRLQRRVSIYVVAILLLFVLTEALASSDEECSRTCPFTITGYREQCTSAADVCACQRSVRSAQDYVARIEREDCTNPVTNTTVRLCEDSRLQRLADQRREVDRRQAKLDQCRQQANQSLAVSQSDHGGGLTLGGKTFVLTLVDDLEGNTFGATVGFFGAEAIWRYRTRNERDNRRIQGRGIVQLSGSTARFNDGKGDWIMEFSPDYRNVWGTYQFRQEWPGRPRTRRYSITGSLQ